MATSRAPWGTLTRAAVVEHAVDVVRTEGSADLSIRSLAARMGVSPMALYRHVDNKEDLLDEVVGRLLADRWRPTVSPRGWRRWITEAADLLRQLLVDQPAALELYLRRPVVSAAALERMDACLTVLTRALGDEGRARDAYAALQSYTIGFAALEAAREANAAGGPPDPPGDGERDAALRGLAGYASPKQFRDGLRYLLAGIVSDG